MEDTSPSLDVALHQCYLVLNYGLALFGPWGPSPGSMLNAVEFSPHLLSARAPSVHLCSVLYTRLLFLQTPVHMAASTCPKLLDFRVAFLAFGTWIPACFQPPVLHLLIWPLEGASAIGACRDPGGAGRDQGSSGGGRGFAVERT